MDSRDPEATLDAVNRQLSRLLHLDQLALQTGGSSSLQDPLWVWGVLGGKDVGKSSLINALAGSDIVDSNEVVGEGTFQPAVYSTRDDLPALQARLGSVEGVSMTYCAEAPATMHGLALVDMPDFDSLFLDHIDQVHRVTSVLDGIIWITTPKKIGDLKGIQEIQQVLKARPNFVYVVNKRSFGWTIDMQLSGGVFGQALLVAVVAALLAGLYPGYKMARTSPARALREE